MKKPNKEKIPPKPAFQKFYENIIENMPDGVTVVDKALKIKVFNQSIQQLTGFSSGRVMNKPFETVFFNNPSLKKRVEDVLKSGTTYTDFDQKLISRYKSEIFIGITAAPLLDSQGKIEGAVLIVRDLTHIKKLEEALRRKERFSSLGSLSAGMAHEIKNPLVGIRGAAQLLGEDAGDTEMREYTQVIIKEVDRINKIVEELLSLSEPRKPEMKPVNIHRILDQILILEKTGVKEKNISFVEKYDPSLPKIVGDEKLLTQVFLNLIRNSIESMPNGGEIKVTTGISSEHVLNLSSQLVRIEIEDSGGGIPQEIKEEIFTPFFTTKNEGTGLGLSISNQIIEEHSGRLELQSGKVKGTVTRVYLPAVRKKQTGRD
jgi:two-component system nitrogen regulation sensor histidine kinase GlnL